MSVCESKRRYRVANGAARGWEADNDEKRRRRVNQVRQDVECF